jgi:hypothetical protein
MDNWGDKGKFWFINGGNAEIKKAQPLGFAMAGLKSFVDCFIFLVF